jgi:hypothetical protein
MEDREINDWITYNYQLILQISKKILRDRYCEGISSYYLHLYKKKEIPKNAGSHIYYYMNYLLKPKSDINYSSNMFKNQQLVGDEVYDDMMDAKIDLNIDFDDNDELIDFLLNNDNSKKWIKIYEILYTNKVELDIFEKSLFDYIFQDGLSVRQVATLTNSSVSWIYQKRVELIKKIKDAI